jgi:Zn-dependent protease
LGVALFVVAGFLSLLAHEMGHAVIGRLLGGGNPVVDLAWLGGICMNKDARLTRFTRLLMTAAGPICSLLLALPVFLLLVHSSGSTAGGVDMLQELLFGKIPAALVETYPPMLVLFGAYVLQVCVWWSVLSLLPIYPLDGGLIMTCLMHSPRKMHIFSMAIAVLLSSLALITGFHIMAILLGLLIVVNYNGVRNSPY